MFFGHEEGEGEDGGLGVAVLAVDENFAGAGAVQDGVEEGKEGIDDGDDGKEGRDGGGKGEVNDGIGVGGRARGGGGLAGGVGGRPECIEGGEVVLGLLEEGVLGDGCLVVALYAYIVAVRIGGGVEGSLGVAVLPEGYVGRIADPDAWVNLGSVCELLHLLHLAVWEGDMVDWDAIGGDTDEVGKVAFKGGEGVCDDKYVVGNEAGAGEHAAFDGFCFNGKLETLCEGKGCAGEASGGIYDDVGEGSIDGDLYAKVAQGDACWGRVSEQKREEGRERYLLGQKGV